MALRAPLRVNAETAAPVGRPHVIGGRLDRDQHQIAGHDGRAGHVVNAGWSVDEDEVVVVGEGREFLVDGRLGQPHDREQRITVTGSGPVESTPLRVGIEQEDRSLFTSERGGQMHGEGRLTDTSFLIEQGNNLGHVPS